MTRLRQHVPYQFLVTTIGVAVVALAVGLGFWPGSLLDTPVVQAQVSRDVTAETVAGWMDELSNWGRWGDDDQLGTLNLITAEKRQAATRLARSGTSVSMSHNYLKEPAADATSPFGHEMLGIGSPGPFRSDRYTLAYHGYAHSHMDSLCHMMAGGQMYNGFVRDEEVTEAGCNRLSIINFKQGIVTRGVLMDIARLKGQEYLAPATPIYVEDLEAWEEQAGIRVEPGDILFVRTGRWARRAEVGPWATSEEGAGLHASVAPWLRERGVAMLGGDCWWRRRWPSIRTTSSHPVSTVPCSRFTCSRLWRWGCRCLTIWISKPWRRKRSDRIGGSSCWWRRRWPSRVARARH